MCGFPVFNKYNYVEFTIELNICYFDNFHFLIQFVVDTQENIL